MLGFRRTDVFIGLLGNHVCPYVSAGCLGSKERENAVPGAGVSADTEVNR